MGVLVAPRRMGATAVGLLLAWRVATRFGDGVGVMLEVTTRKAIVGFGKASALRLAPSPRYPVKIGIRTIAIAAASAI